VGDVLDVGGPHHPGGVDGHVHEQAIEIDVLLGVGVDEVVVVVAGDGQHRLPSSLAS
jgi:hypothetical protein